MDATAFLPLTAPRVFVPTTHQVREVIECRNLLQKEVARKEEILKGFLDDKQIPKALRVAAKDAYTYYIKMRPSLAEGGLYDELPTALVYRLVEHMFHKEISHVTIFHNITDRAFISRLVVHSRPYQAAFGEVVYEEKGVAECMSFIVRGSVRLTTSAGGKRESLVGYATAGNFFGDFEFYRRSLRVAKYVSVRNSNLYSVDYTHIADAVEEHFEAGAVFTSALKKRYNNFVEVLRDMQKPIPASMLGKRPTLVRRLSTSLNRSFKSVSHHGSRAGSRAGSRKPSVVPGSSMSRKMSQAFYFSGFSSNGSNKELPPESARGPAVHRTDSGYLEGNAAGLLPQQHGSAAAEKIPAGAPHGVNATAVATALDGLAAARSGHDESRGVAAPSNALDSDGRRRRALFGTTSKKGDKRRASKDIGVALKQSPHHVTLWMDGNKEVNESADDAIAAEAVVSYNLSSKKSPEVLYPCVVRVPTILFLSRSLCAHSCPSSACLVRWAPSRTNTP